MTLDFLHMSAYVVIRASATCCAWSVVLLHRSSEGRGVTFRTFEFESRQTVFMNAYLIGIFLNFSIVIYL